MIITIGGRAGSGKSTAGKLLAKKLGLKFYSMGNLTRKFAEERGLTLPELNKLQETDSTIDTQIDNLQKELAKKEDAFVIDSRLGVLFIPNANFKVFLDADETVRAQRILKDSRTLEKSTELKETLAKLKVREESEIKRYKQYYNFDCYDNNKYDISINTTNLTPEEVVAEITGKIKEKGI